MDQNSELPEIKQRLEAIEKRINEVSAVADVLVNAFEQLARGLAPLRDLTPRRTDMPEGSYSPR